MAIEAAGNLFALLEENQYNRFITLEPHDNTVVDEIAESLAYLHSLFG